MKKLVMTGGHAGTTALATINEFEKKGLYEIHWIGAKYAVEGKKALTLEFRIFPEQGVFCHPIFTGRLQRRFSRHTLFSMLRIPVGVIHAFLLLLLIRPKAILSFGGFAAFPVVFAGWVFRIPIVIHEQTASVGLANKFSKYFANKIAVSREESKKYFPLSKTVVTGNPVLPGFLTIKPRKKISKTPVIFVTGGSRGSQRINNTLELALPELLSNYRVIHQCGQIDFEHFRAFSCVLNKKYRSRYEVYSNIDPFEISSFFEKSDIIISRAGANTVSEIILASRPSILIPIPWSRFDEQNLNAKEALEIGVSVILNQNDLDKDSLLGAISKVDKNWKKMSENAQNASKKFIDRKAAFKLYNVVCEAAEKEG